VTFFTIETAGKFSAHPLSLIPVMAAASALTRLFAVSAMDHFTTF
jgi:hypothetical protein